MRWMRKKARRKKRIWCMGWKLGESADLTAMLEAQLVSSVLMENSASPLMHYSGDH